MGEVSFKPFIHLCVPYISRHHYFKFCIFIDCTSFNLDMEGKLLDVSEKILLRNSKVFRHFVACSNTRIYDNIKRPLLVQPLSGKYMHSRTEVSEWSLHTVRTCTVGVLHDMSPIFFKFNRSLVIYSSSTLYLDGFQRLFMFLNSSLYHYKYI